MVKVSGIYKIQSKSKPNRYYIGSSIDVKNRWRQHLNGLRNNKHGNPRLQNHYNKYGEDDLFFSIIVGCEAETLLMNEQYFIDSHLPYFNIQTSTTSTNLGRKFSDEVKKRVSDAHKGIKQSEENKAKKSQSLKGKIPWNVGIPTRQSTKEKQSIKLRGKTWEEIYGIEGAKLRLESIREKWRLKKLKSVA